MILQDCALKVLGKLLASHSCLIFGLGKEGLSTYQFIRKHLPNQAISITDDKSLSEVPVEWQTALSSDPHLQFFSISELESQPELFESLVIFKAPGIPHTHALFARQTKNLVLTSNTALFFTILAQLPPECMPQTVGVTGTKGKSTTTSLIAHVLQASGRPVFLAGNIGVPAISVLNELEKLDDSQLSSSIVVCELSSHQLQEMEVSPHIAVLQNITPEHLDYYRSFSEYVRAKARITHFQTSTDILIFDPDFELPKKIALNSKARPFTYSLQANDPQLNASFLNGSLYYGSDKIIDQTELPLLGEHNLLNTFPAIIIGKLFDIPTEKIANSLKSFKSLEHRLEFVASKNGVQYYNDSQGTTPEAAIAAIASFPEQEVILLAGGSDKGVSFTQLAQTILEKNISHLILFPPTGVKIEAALQDVAQSMNSTLHLPEVTHVGSMPEAVKKAAAVATPGSIVLLSPACASFGLFKNYQDRGNQFKAAVLAL